ncbi:hypothetical protein THOM_2275 [Trachipleistophora hominis]|uniref:Uncharacterized protein n=1 Tax=Trachipleistophora hominis TaxID=72359 RepID=L7JTK6_TRAHO|nr:hypothetical protein THOM_2275 [Trachipleistophora hominis]
MSNESKLQKILHILNSSANLENYIDMLESIDLVLNVNDDEKDYFMCPEEANLQLPNVFLRQTKLLECKHFIKSKANNRIGEHFYENCREILDFLESVELQEPEFMESKKKPDIDVNLLRELVKKYIY